VRLARLERMAMQALDFTPYFARIDADPLRDAFAARRAVMPFINFDPEKIDACLDVDANRISIDVQFFNTDGEAMLKIFVGRDDKGALRQEQIDRLSALQDRLTASSAA
jgi:hypothetical protein